MSDEPLNALHINVLREKAKKAVSLQGFNLRLDYIQDVSNLLHQIDWLTDQLHDKLADHAQEPLVAENYKLRRALRALIEAGSRGSADFDSEARRAEETLRAPHIAPKENEHAKSEESTGETGQK